MKIISQTKEVLTRRITTINWIDCTYTVIDYIDVNGKIVDTVYRDEDGNELCIEESSTIERLESFMADVDDEEQDRRDEKNGLIGSKIDIAN
jgi:hypothetical protein